MRATSGTSSQSLLLPMLVVGLVAVLVMGGCESNVDIIGECELRTDAVRLQVDDREGLVIPDQASHNVGRLGHLTLFEWGEILQAEWPQYGIRWVQWYDEGFGPVGEPVALGTFRAGRTQWVAVDGALEGQVWADPASTEPPPPDREILHRWRIPPPPAEPSFERIPARGSERCPDCGAPRIGSGSGPISQLPSALAYDDLWSAFVYQPPVCDYDRPYINYDRLFLVSGNGLHPVLWGVDPCALQAQELQVQNPWLVSLSDGGLGVLFRVRRRGDEWRPLHYARVGPDGELLEDPRLVDGARGHSTTGIGFQPRAVQVEGGRVLFAELHNECHALRVMREDGSRVRDAPWQLPCMRPGSDEITGRVELVSVPGGAVLVWTVSKWRTRGDAEHLQGEGVYAVLLTSQGKRGSEIVRISDEGARAWFEHLIGAAGDGFDLTVSWSDQRSGAPGVYVRGLRCRVDD
ncbi:MAG: hypothetical protein ACOC97_04330 [Myxococcota bacterium]